MRENGEDSEARDDDQLEVRVPFSKYSTRTAALSHVFTTEMCSLPISVRYGGQLYSCTAGDYCNTGDGMVNVSTVMPNNQCLDSKGDEIEDK
jgi:hypothetical protein